MQTSSIYKSSSQWLTLSTSNPLDSDPPQKEHGGMVVDMQERHLAVLLTKNEENLEIIMKVVARSKADD